MPTYPVRRKLPVTYSTEIGRIITRWAWLEWELRRVAYTVLQIGPKEGRLSIREPRAHEYLTMIEDLMSVRHLSASDKLKPHFKSAKKALERNGDFRNALAHGIWIKHEGTDLPTLQIVSGSLVNISNLPEPLPKAKIEPRALAIELSGLKAAVHDIESLTGFIQKLRKEIEAQLSPSPDKPEPPPRGRAARRAHNQATQRIPPRSSQR